jgi:hypothetical protein
MSLGFFVVESNRFGVSPSVDSTYKTKFIQLMNTQID